MTKPSFLRNKFWPVNRASRNRMPLCLQDFPYFLTTDDSPLFTFSPIVGTFLLLLWCVSTALNTFRFSRTRTFSGTRSKKINITRPEKIFYPHTPTERSIFLGNIKDSIYHFITENEQLAWVHYVVLPSPSPFFFILSSTTEPTFRIKYFHLRTLL